MTDLEDFEAFLEPSFDSLQFANGLLLATNDDEKELDLLTPMKKLQFDINECEKRMQKVSSTHYQTLVSNLKEVDTTKEVVEEQLGPQLQRLNVSFQRIQSSLMTPYEDALKLNKSLKKIHATLKLLRGAGFFMFLVQQLEERAPDQKETDSHSSGRKDLVRLAKVHIQLNKLYENNSKSTASYKTVNSSNKDPNLLSIKIVRDYQSIHASKRADLTSQCTSIITNDVNHHSTFTYSNAQLQDALLALYILDPNECFHTIDRATISKQTQVISNQLSRALQSPRNFTAVIEEVFESSEKFLYNTNDILENARVSDSRTLLREYLLFNQEAGTLSNLYWSKLGNKFKRNVAATMARGGPIAKNLKIYHEGIKKAILERFGNSDGSAVLIDAIDLIGGIN
ncbi:conserved oligomeric Golgi complex subunit 5 [[Candida] railenensis]|uniref:Conserved oligomeric Golgi complex subunit 5 n=1 Tax=[Candida] railenensis TaxID=45579 RepID=A0A9P0VW78_9ASCO|nr:conserved oligomeric Golgi complex subunit 5 [[Candida] railenensis]